MHLGQQTVEAGLQVSVTHYFQVVGMFNIRN